MNSFAKRADEPDSMDDMDDMDGVSEPSETDDPAEPIRLVSDVAGERLDRFLPRVLPELSRVHAQRLIASGDVLVDGRARRASYALSCGERVTCRLPAPEKPEALPEHIPLDILYEDGDIIVVNKPRGMTVHPAPGAWHGTLVNALLAHCGDLSGINGVIRPGIVHRLDKDTSGVMVAAKNDMAHMNLAEQIRTKKARRIYNAIVHGNIVEPSGLIEGAIGRDPKNRKRMAINREHGKPAVTEFSVLERFGDYTLVECVLRTGRTHQIRVHMSSIGHPLAGDEKYGSRDPHLPIRGQALHSRRLALVHPRTSRPMEFEAPLPGDMQEMLGILRNHRIK